MRELKNLRDGVAGVRVTSAGITRCISTPAGHYLLRHRPFLGPTDPSPAQIVSKQCVRCLTQGSPMLRAYEKDEGAFSCSRSCPSSGRLSNWQCNTATDTWRKIDYGFKRLKDAHTSLDDENVCLKNRCASLKKSVKRLKKSLVYLKDKINELTDKVTDLSMHVLTLSNREIQLGERIMQLEASNAQLEASNAQLLARNAQLENESNAREMNNENDL
ncbi:unnamed protein product [Dovyalis caffra]|uniref:Uncharacterized protein n=1 Tax=Dovyalis caffra TaxID=77055 RepID=A0AAV1RHK4_9ROSI|nr:unnamed protein product [Dovyalis caffra]